MTKTPSNANGTTTTTEEQQQQQQHPPSSFFARLGHMRTDSSLSLDDSHSSVIYNTNNSLTDEPTTTTHSITEVLEVSRHETTTTTQTSPVVCDLSQPVDLLRKNSEQSFDSKNLPPPTTPFFQQYYDSDSGMHSDGAGSFIVLTQSTTTTANNNNQNTNSNHTTTTTTNNNNNAGNQGARERFPSFDSVGSSGSLIRTTTTNNNNTTQQPRPPPPPRNPSLLPYHERRKLMQQNQQQQQQQQQQPPRPGRPSMPPPVPAVAGTGAPPQIFAVPPFHPPQPFPPLQHQFGGGFPPPNHPQFAFPPPLPYHHHPQSGFPPPPTTLQQQPQRFVQQASSSSQRPPPYAPRQPQQPSPQKAPIIARTIDASSSLDSEEPPPPPPPPPVVPPPHVRQDSMDTVSSLDTPHNESSETEGHRLGFFQRLWKPVAPNVNDFHRMNQKFLANHSSPHKQPFPPNPVHSTLPNTKNRRPARLDTPPPSRGGRRRLNSIENDDWTEPGDEENFDHRGDHGFSSSSEMSGEESSNNPLMANETTRLLPPSGISSNEYYDRYFGGNAQSNHNVPQISAVGFATGAKHLSPETFDSTTTERLDNTTTSAVLNQFREERAAKKKKKKKRRSRKNRHRRKEEASETSSHSSNSVSSHEYRKWVQKRSALLEKERTKLISQWKVEARRELEQARMLEERDRWHRRISRCFESTVSTLVEKSYDLFAYCEGFFANLPLTLGAIALSTANLGVDWFKFAEENMDSCEPVHFHSAQCTFPEFPGCFYCDRSARMYKVAERFHYACSTFAGILALTFVLKLVIARRLAFDELSSPTTASPAGLLCMTLAIVFAGRGLIGKVIVCSAAFIHLCLAFWFMYMALAYRIMADPSWFPNTTGLGISAVKAWLYYPTAGHFLMAISLSLNFFFFPISVVRVFLNRKISATVGWMQMSAPNISLYALTIMAQPSFEEERPDISSFQKVHRRLYLPCMHFLFLLCMVGIVASVHSLVVRWKEFLRLPFSPAHAAFCAPCLSHANAIQAYRAAVISFSSLPTGHPFLICLYTYWVSVLFGGSCVYICIAGKYLASLGKWTHFDLEDEVEPPAPYETSMTLTNMLQTGENMVQPYVSPAILQANETGMLYLTRDAQGRQQLRRTRKITALGFEPIMDTISMEQERELLLDWVGKHTPRRRSRTLSVPGIDFSYGLTSSDWHVMANHGAYDVEDGRDDFGNRRHPWTTSLSSDHRKKPNL